MGTKNVQQWIEQGQGPNLLFLPARTRALKLGESLTALANTHGGHLLLGVRGGRRADAEGLPDPEASRIFVLEVAQSCVPPMILPIPEAVSIQGKVILVVTVPAGLPHVYHWRGRYLQRVKNKSVPLNGTELRGLLLERSESGFETLQPEQATLDDLDMTQVKDWKARVDEASEDPLPLLLQRGCLVHTPEGYRPTYAGLLLFGRKPQTFLPQAQILLVQHNSTAPEANPLRQETQGTLPAQIHQAEAFLHRHMRRGRMWVDSQRVEVTEYPLEAVQEAIINAVAHRDYSIRGDHIRLSMFQNRIEVHSPGRLPGPITVDNILEERYSRNPVIVQVLADMGLIERLGYGVDRMVALMQEASLPAPAFCELRAGFSLTLYGPKEMALKGIPSDPQSLARLGLNERQVQALVYLNEHGQITSRDYQELCPKMSAETLRRDLVDLISRGMLLKVGERRATYYILK